MGFVKSLFTGPPKPREAQLMQGVNQGQVDTSFGQAQYGLGQQQSFLNALQAQNGIQNLADVYAQQQGTAGQLQGIANGTGPNPALAQLQNTTGQNVANQAALMAGQRGTGANAGLLARQAAMQGAGIQQQAVGQGAALQAQQQINAINALQQQQANMANVANTQTGNLASGLNAYNSAAQNEQGNLLNAMGQFNNAQVGATGNYNNARQAGYNSDMALTGALAGAGSAVMAGGAGAAGGKKAYGGLISSYASGGPVAQPQSMAANYIHGSNALQRQPLPNLAVAMPSSPDIGASFRAGSEMVKAMTQKAAGGAISGESLASRVPGQASVRGDSLKNDTVPALLSPGEVVIPRHIMEGKNPAEMAKKFVAAIVAKGGLRK